MSSTVTEKACIVCGMGSHRTDWKTTGTLPTGDSYVACDSHSAKEVSAVIAKATPVPTGQSSQVTKTT